MHTSTRLTAALALAMAFALAACQDGILSDPESSPPAVAAPARGPALDEVPPDSATRCTGQAGSHSGRCE